MHPPSAHRYIFVRVRGDDSTYGSERQYCHGQALNRAFPLVSGMLLEYSSDQKCLSYPEGKMKKVTFGEQWRRDAACPTDSPCLPRTLARPPQLFLMYFLGHFHPQSGTNLQETPNPGRFPEGKVGDSGRNPGSVFLTTS